MTQIELFAGIGNFGLAGHWAGIETICQVEIDPFCQKVLQKTFHMHTDTTTSTLLTAHHTPEQLTLFQGDSPANRTAQPERDSGKKMSAICGPKCLESFKRHARVGLWAKTLAGLLVGRQGWFSRRCALTWRLSGTKYNRLYFRLVPSTPRTDGIGYGLLHTPRALMIDETPENFQRRMGDRNSTTFPHLLAQMKYGGMLPTQNAKPSNRQTTDGKNISQKTGQKFGLSIVQAAKLLPTPTAQDGKNATLPPSQIGLDSMPGMLAASGKSGHLNPRFVEWMMGFPPDWTNIETND